MQARSVLLGKTLLRQQGQELIALVRPAMAIIRAIMEFEFHLSPALSSSRPQTGVGTVAVRSSSWRAAAGSLLSWRGPPTAQSRSGI